MSEELLKSTSEEVVLLRDRVSKLEKQTENLNRQLADLKKALNKYKFDVLDI